MQERLRCEAPPYPGTVEARASRVEREIPVYLHAYLVDAVGRLGEGEVVGLASACHRRIDGFVEVARALERAADGNVRHR